MKRKNIPQISTQTWFPTFLRNNIHEFMTWFVNRITAAVPFMPIIEEGLGHAKDIVVLEAVGGTGFETVQPLLDSSIPLKYDKLHSPQLTEKGLYLSVNAFHQLNPKQAKQLLQDVMK